MDSSRQPVAFHHPTFRHDIDGLRAVAILIVVAFHAGVPFLDAGFIGVDVFFVVSGFLITQRLLAEAAERGSVDLLRFWVRRARRLLPAATTMVVITLAISFVVLVPLTLDERLTDAWASSFYWANIRFGSLRGSYFGASAEASPFLHMWSLSVEEQFYVVWPAIVALPALVVRMDRHRRVVLAIALALTVLSFLYSVADVRTPSPMTYYDSLSRCWELGAGALLALVWPEVQRATRSPRHGTILRSGGVMILVVSLMVISPDRMFPGWIATLPVLASLLLIAAHADAGPVGRLLNLGPIRQIGRWSYSWYLWHWPVIVLGRAALERWGPFRPGVADGWSVSLALAVMGLVPAVISYRMIEVPFRRSRWLGQSPARGGLVVVGMLAASLALLAGFGWQASRTLDQPAMLALAEARDDWPHLPAECSTSDADQLLNRCRAGTPDAERTLLLGDSHMANWAPGISSAVVASGGEVVRAMGGSCTVIGNGTDSEAPWCTAMRVGLGSAITELSPDRIILSHSAAYEDLLDSNGSIAEDQLGQWESNLQDFAATTRAVGAELVVILATPKNDVAPLDCASQRDDPGSCVLSRVDAWASARDFNQVQVEVIDEFDGLVIDPVELLCPAVDCLFEDNGEYVWNDEHHITNAYSSTLGPTFGVVLGLPGSHQP